MSKIEWTKETKNPITGCAKVSPECKMRYCQLVRFSDGVVAVVIQRALRLRSKCKEHLAEETTSKERETGTN